jgi:flagellar biosynthesis protein FlhG
MRHTARESDGLTGTAAPGAVSAKSRSQRLARAIAFTSGKGGVGKSNIAAAAAVLLAQYGKRVLLVDADLGLANIDVLFGLRPRLTLQHVLREGRSLDEAMVEGPCGITVLPAASGLQDLTWLAGSQLDELLGAFRVLDSQMDYILFDTPAGISLTVTAFLEPSDRVVLVTMPEPTALTDAYALIKVLAKRGRRDRIGVLVNQAAEAEARAIFRGLAWVTEQFLDQQLDYLGHAPRDGLVAEAVRRQRPIALAYPEAPFVSALRSIILKWVNNEAASVAGGIEAFARDALTIISDDGHTP